MSTTKKVDLVVVGLGPGGEALATGAASAGLKVVAVDRHLVGGECPYYACIPTKIMLRAADALAEAKRASSLAGDVSVVRAWQPVAERLREATSDWDDRAAVERLEGAGVTVLHGTGRLDGPGRVVVELPGSGSSRTFAADRGVVLNPGTRPATPPIKGLEGTPYWTNRDAVRAESVPAELIVVGGGPVGCELAQTFARFATAVTIVQRGDRLLPNDEPDASTALRDVLVADGVRVLTGRDTTEVAHADGRFTVTLDDGEQLGADRLLVAAGRTPNLGDLGLDTVGISADDIEVDERLRVQDRLWVIGDVTGKGAYTHVSMYQSAIALRDILGREGEPASYEAVPHTTFTDPEVAGVGLTEAAARARGLRVQVGRADLGASSRGFTHGPGAAGLVKLVADADRGVLVGGTVVGPAGGEVLSMITLAVHAEVPVARLRTMIYAYPTFHRSIESAVDDLDAGE